jgi:hypothetical protein
VNLLLVTGDRRVQGEKGRGRGRIQALCIGGPK